MEKLLTIEEIDLNVKTSLGDTPLHFAVFSPPSKHDMMRMLVNAGADIEARNSWNNTPACLSVGTEYKSQPMPIEVHKGHLICRYL